MTKMTCSCANVKWWPQSAIEEIVDYFDIFHQQVDLKGIGKRSRIGKGSCQGNFCSLRIAAFLYDRDLLSADQGTAEIKSFINERWKGQRCLLWDTPVVQTELQEAMHCGFFGLELKTDD